MDVVVRENHSRGLPPGQRPVGGRSRVAPGFATLVAVGVAAWMLIRLGIIPAYRFPR
jgi:hypothetical protein